MIQPLQGTSGVQPSRAAVGEQRTGDTERVELGAGRPHDTETPDIETASDAYARNRFTGAIGRWLLDQQTRLIERMLDHAVSVPLAVLEVGGGHGQVTPLLIARGHNVVVHGSHPVCFQRIESLLDDNPDRLSTCVSSLQRLPFENGEFDMVVAVRLLGHVSQWRALVREMARVSRRYVLLEFARAAPPLGPRFGRALFAVKRTAEGATRPFYTYSEHAVVAELEMLGLTRVAAGAQFAVPMFIHRLGRMPALSDAAERVLRRLGVGDNARSPVILMAQHRSAAESMRGMCRP